MKPFEISSYRTQRKTKKAFFGHYRLSEGYTCHSKSILAVIVTQPVIHGIWKIMLLSEV